MAKVIVLPTKEGQSTYNEGRIPDDVYLREFATEDEADAYVVGIESVEGLVEYDISEEGNRSLRLVIADDATDLAFTTVAEKEAFKLGLEDGDGYDCPEIFREGETGFDDLADAAELGAEEAAHGVVRQRGKSI